MQHNKSVFYRGSRELLSESIHNLKHYHFDYSLYQVVLRTESVRFQSLIPFEFQTTLFKGLKIQKKTYQGKASLLNQSKGPGENIQPIFEFMFVLRSK